MSRFFRHELRKGDPVHFHKNIGDVDVSLLYDAAFLQPLPDDVVLSEFQVSGDTSPGIHFNPNNLGIDRSYQIVVNGSHPVVKMISPGSWTDRDSGTLFLGRVRMPRDFHLGDVGDPGATAGTPNNPGIVYNKDTKVRRGLNATTRTKVGGSVFGYRYSQRETSHGGSGTLGGEITARDLRGRPRHAGAWVGDSNKYLSSTGKGFIWPAYKADSTYNVPATADYYGGNDPRLLMGMRLAVPRDVTAEDIGVSSATALWFLEMMQEWGVYYIDSSGWEGNYICASVDAAATLSAAKVEIEKIMNWAQLVIPKPLDQVDDALAGYALRNVKGEYTHPLLLVRRSIDNLEQDFYATSDGKLDTAALLEFCGAGDGFVKIWYDQTGNGRHFTQTVAAWQPRIVNAGVLETLNSKPSMRFDGVDDFMVGTAFMFDNGNATAVMAASGTANALKVLLGETSNNNNTPLYYLIRQHNTPGDTASFTFRDDSNNLSPSTPAGSIINTFSAAQTLRVISVTDTGSNVTNWVDGVQNVTASYTRGTTTLTSITIGASKVNGVVGNFFTGHISELAIYPALSDTDRQSLESNLMGHFAVA